MRGVSLTERETARLMGVSHAACFRILRGLVAEGSLRQTSEGRYMVADVLP
jgi:DNA-binding IclR family transcriptional regulator